MKALIVSCLIAGLCWSAGTGWAEEAAESVADPHVVQLLTDLEATDEQLAEAQQQLETAPRGTARRHLRTTIRDLQAEQERLLHELELAILGPRPPVVRDEPPSSLEQQLERQERHHEAILESDVERRFPSE